MFLIKAGYDIAGWDTLKLPESHILQAFPTGNPVKNIHVHATFASKCWRPVYERLVIYKDR